MAALLGLSLASPALAQRQSVPLAPVRLGPDSTDVCRGPCMPRRPWTAIGETFLINAFVLGINKLSRPEDEGFHIGLQSWKRNLQLGWEWDENTFSTNVFAHPYHGSMYFNAGRANGLSYWESVPLAFLGSWEWEYLGETHRPSLNDFFFTSLGGIALGEMTHRAASVVRDNGARGRDRTWSEIWGTLIDPLGSFNRLIHGEMNDVGPNPQEHFPTALGLLGQAGVRVVGDSLGDLNNAAAAPTFLVDLTYGDPFAAPFQGPWDAFRFKAQVSPGKSVAGGWINLVRAYGRLYSRELAAPDAPNRHQFTVWQRHEYVNNPAYVFGGETAGFGILSRWGSPGDWSVVTSAALEGIIMGAVGGDTVSSGGGRLYDFGPGIGFSLSASVHRRGMRVLDAGYRSDYVHSVSGFDADHYVHFVGVEGIAPIRRGLGLGGTANFYARNSRYSWRAPEDRTFPEFRVFLSWTLDHRPATAVSR